MIRNIAVLGAGTMGHGIAETFAMYGYPVNLYETSEKIRCSVMESIKSELYFASENGLLEKSEIESNCR